MTAPRRAPLWQDTAIARSPIRDVTDVETDSDDLVIGAGLTGLTAAVLLARAGRRVTVLEARTIGAAATGHTTAKISLLQGTRYSQILRHHPPERAQAYLRANREGKAWLERYCAEHGVDVQTRDAVTWAQSEGGLTTLREEYEACSTLGLEVERHDDFEAPFDSAGAIRLADQSQFDPMQALDALAADLRARGGQIIEGARARGLSSGEPTVVRSTAGDFTAENVVIATGVPFLDRGFHFAQVTPERSYAMAFEVPGLEPTAMCLSVDAPGRSVRTAPTADGERLLVGGNGHVVGRASSPSPLERVRDLTAWTQAHYPGARATHRWSAQDYATHDHLPVAGRLLGGGGRTWVATGYAKWGMTNAVAAALHICAEMLGDSGDSETTTIGHFPPDPSVLVRGAVANAKVGLALTTGWAKAYSAGSVDPTQMETGSAAVGRHGAAPVAVSTVDGVTCSVSAICSHLGGIVRWNDAEESWDCPLHGSRFAPDGSVLEGPATEPLTPEPQVPRV